MSETQQTKQNKKNMNFVVEIPRDYDWQYILTETGLTKSRISELMRYFARLPLDIQLSVMRDQLDDYAKNKERWKEAYARRATEARYVQFLNAINRQYKFEHQLERKSVTEDNEEELSRLTQQRFQRLQQQKGKKDRKFRALQQRRFVLRQLRRQGASWRDIQLYMQKYHHIKISHSYLQRVYSLFFDENDEEIL